MSVINWADATERDEWLDAIKKRLDQHETTAKFANESSTAQTERIKKLEDEIKILNKKILLNSTDPLQGYHQSFHFMAQKFDEQNQRMINLEQQNHQLATNNRELNARINTLFPCDKLNSTDPLQGYLQFSHFMAQKLEEQNRRMINLEQQNHQLATNNREPIARLNTLFQHQQEILQAQVNSLFTTS